MKTQVGYIIKTVSNTKNTIILKYHHRKHQGLDRLIRSVSRVTTAPAKVSSVFRLFSFLVVCSGISPVFPLEILSWVGCPQDG
jgi:hypothetical protein